MVKRRTLNLHCKKEFIVSNLTSLANWIDMNPYNKGHENKQTNVKRRKKECENIKSR